MTNDSSYRPISDLVNHNTEWGVSVRESKSRDTTKTASFKVVAFVAYVLAAFIAIPLLIAVLVFPEPSGLLQIALIVLLCIAAAGFFQAQSKKGPKNAIQIDYDASEVRLGSELPNGAFIRHRVCPFRAIEKVTIDSTDADNPAICIRLADEVVKVGFQGADVRSLEMLAVKLSAARETAHKAPLGTRVRSAIFGIEAATREVSRRVRSRIESRPA